ncbi:MAG: hypothetical protein ND866_31795, partial [Pyrinomonadaceae bacterium]|nr:hypothetical protein [Pyrinomonadaceae bacterium]
MLDDIATLENSIKTAGELGRAKLQDIKLDDVRRAILNGDVKLDADKWTKRAEQDQWRLRDRLSMVRDSLHGAAGLDGPQDTKHIMYDEYASSPSIVIWALLGMIMTAALLVQIVSNWKKATGTDLALKIQAAAAQIQKLEDTAKKETDAKAN